MPNPMQPVTPAKMKIIDRIEQFFFTQEVCRLEKPDMQCMLKGSNNLTIEIKFKEFRNS